MPVAERSQVTHRPCARTGNMDGRPGNVCRAYGSAALCRCSSCAGELTTLLTAVLHERPGCRRRMAAMPGGRHTLRCGACHHLRNATQRHGGQHSRETRAQRIAGQGRIEADAQNNAVHLFCHADNANDQHHPRDNGRAVRCIGHCADQQLDKHQIEYHQCAHGRKHPEPAAKNLCGGFGAAHGKCQRRTS